MRRASCLTSASGRGGVGNSVTAASGLSEQVGRDDRGAGGADVDRQRAALPRLDVEVPGLAAAAAFPLRAFEDQSRAQQVVHQEADGAGGQSHQPGQVGARDRLLLADQIQRDLAVDLAGGAARRDPEGGGIDAAHRSQAGIVLRGRKSKFLSREKVDMMPPPTCRRTPGPGVSAGG